MKKLLPIAVGLILISSFCYGQTDSFKTYRNFPIIVSIQMHSLALPFHDLKTNFGNLGIGVGTEISYNGKQNWVQQINLVWYHNRETGNGIMLYTQPAWRPTLGANIYAEIKLGAGYLLSQRPVESFKQVNGDWISVGHRGKGMLVIPAGISFGYNKYSSKTYLSPFISYQVLFLSGYNKSIPLVPETLLQIGSRIHLNY